MYNQPQLKRNGGVRWKRAKSPNTKITALKIKESSCFYLIKMWWGYCTIYYPMSQFSENDLTYIKPRSQISLQFHILSDSSPDILYPGLTLKSFIEEQSKELINFLRVTQTQKFTLLKKTMDLKSFRKKKGREQVSHTLKKCFLHF